MPIDKPAWFRMAQRRPLSAAPDLARPAPLLYDEEHRPVQTLGAWLKRKVELRKTWRAFLGTYDQPRGGNAIQIVREERLEGVTRKRIRYESEPGEEVSGYLLVPDPPGRGRAGIVAFHGTNDLTIRQPAGVEGPADMHFGLHLARRGYVVLCPECFLWRHGRPGKPATAVEWLKARRPKATGMAKMLFDATRAVDLLAALPEVDPRRLGAIGHSLGGKEAFYLAAFDERVRATAASEPGIGIKQSNWDAPWYLGEAVKKPDFHLDHGQVLGMIAPRAFLLIGGESADGDPSWPYIGEALALWKLAGDPDGVGLYNHRRGHAFPALAQDRADEWLDWFLQARAG